MGPRSLEHCQQDAMGESSHATLGASSKALSHQVRTTLPSRQVHHVLIRFEAILAPTEESPIFWLLQPALELFSPVRLGWEQLTRIRIDPLARPLVFSLRSARRECPALGKPRPTMAPIYNAAPRTFRRGRERHARRVHHAR